MPKLTKTIVDAAELKDGPYFIWCSELPGFGVRVFPSGKRVYYADYRNKAGVRKRMSLGPHGKLTTEAARKLAVITLGGVLKGEDPAHERATRRTSLTMRELCDDYLKAAERGLIMGKGQRPKKASTLYADRGRIERHIKPLLGRKLVKDIVRADVVRFISDVTLGKTAAVEKTKLRGKAVVEGGSGAAARTAGLLGGTLSYAVATGVIDSNPAFGVARPAYKSRKRRLSPEEFRALGDALVALKQEGERWQVIAGVRLLALTGCRFEEVEGLKWSEVKPAEGMFALDDSKEGESVRPVGRAAFDVLAEVEREPDAVFVFPPVRSERGHFRSLSAGLERVAKRAGFTDVTAHTLRHSFASVADDLGFTESTIAAMLGHAKGSVTSRYTHKLDSLLVAAADKVSRTIHGYMTGAEATVIALPPRAAKT